MADAPSELRLEVEKLERKHAENPEGRYFVPLANALRKLGQLDRAEALLRDGLRRHPEYLSAHIVLGRCLADRADTRAAAEEFRFVLSLDPQNLIALRTLGELALAEGRTDEGERWYRELLAVDPMNEEARRALVGLEAREDETPVVAAGVAALVAPVAGGTAPVQEPEDGGEEDADDAAFAYSGGRVDLDAGEDDAALPAFGEPGEEPVEPEEEVVTETIAELYARQGFHGRAAEVYRRLLARRGGDAALRARLAEMERLAAGAAVEPVGEPAVEPRPGPAPSGGEVERSTIGREDGPAEMDPSPDAVPPWIEALDGEPPARDDAPVPGGTIGEYLRGLAAWSPGRAGVAEQAPPAGTARDDGDGMGSAAEDRFPWEEDDAGEPMAAEAGFGAGWEPEVEEGRPAPESPSAPARADDDDDLESFQAWLRSLKR